ncbi:BlaI/MecI/CopY family transcriptional regulator [Kangiella sp. TOML190]|uniref:BlaI/MecI/CopY family transcriptional regulator n=1 Tax=Kangiella sp. TOML190 TaxID=2931351 RepID=UPI00203BDF30|nr:BlaI/MecI/CopY family transcriptional regulator [Kangiella sp. TOML190]
MLNRVSESEHIVMEVLWQESPLTSLEICERLKDQGWNEKTVKTFLNRMVKKKVINFKKEGRRYWYSPAIKRAAFIQQESKGFLNKMFNGDVKQLLATFVQNKQLSKQELDYLKELISQEGDGKEIKDE